jgi:hypothetical protein
MIAVEGHTDSDPLPKNLRVKYPSNWELSGARAAAVVRLLIGLDVDPVRSTISRIWRICATRQKYCGNNYSGLNSKIQLYSTTKIKK